MEKGCFMPQHECLSFVKPSDGRVLACFSDAKKIETPECSWNLNSRTFDSSTLESPVSPYTPAFTPSIHADFVTTT